MVATATDKKKFEQSLMNPADFTPENIIASFGDYIENPRANILRGLAEVFTSLDSAYKSHNKVKIGVNGLPKRIILTGFSEFTSYHCENKIRDILNALAAYQNKPLVHHAEIQQLVNNGFLQHARVIGEKLYPSRGVWLKRFKNGNGHLYFDNDTLKDINLALAEFYGDVLPDETGEKPTKKQASTAVSKDLQYYPTPKDVINDIAEQYNFDQQLVLEPSCGCGRIMDALRAKGATVHGYEFDPSRAALARSKGHNVLTANFLDTVPTPKYDHVVMNPPFYGKHYMKHIKHAFQFLKEGGTLTCILPATARYDHGLVDEFFNVTNPRWNWTDLKTGSFKESGTNIQISVFNIKKRSN